MVFRRQTESKPAKRPRGKGPPRAYRVKMERHNAMLHDWAQRRLGLREAPVHNEALAGKHITFRETTHLT